MSLNNLPCARLIAAAILFAGWTPNVLADGNTAARLTLQPVETHGAPAMRATLDHFPPEPIVSVRVERPDGKSDDAVVEQKGDAFIARYPRADVPGEYTFVVCAAADDVIRIARRSVAFGAKTAKSSSAADSNNAAGSRNSSPPSTKTAGANSPKSGTNGNSVGGAKSHAMGTVQSIDGQYVRWNRGAIHGIRQGFEVRFLRGGIEIGRGRAIDVREAESDVEIDSISGVAEVAVGDTVEAETAARPASAGPP